MNILIGFLPFLAFAVVGAVVGTAAGLAVAAVVAAAMLARGLAAGRSLKILELGTVLLFCGLAAYTLLAPAAPSIWMVRLLVDAGLFAIVLVSMALGRPFTLQYAREMVDPSLWDNPQFYRVNLVITGVWAAAFAAMVLSDLVLAAMPGVPRPVGVIVATAALVGAVKFTTWYPKRRRAALARQ